MPPKPSPDDVQRLSEVSSLAQRLRELEELRQEGSSALAHAMYAAHQHGHTWSEIARAAELASPTTARTRAERAMPPEELSPSVRWRMERGNAPREKTTPPGISVSDAAKRLGVTRHTVYAWIDKGKLTATADEAGRTRVLLDD